MTVLKELRGVSREAEKHLKEKNGFLNSLKEVAVKEIPSEPVQNWPWSKDTGKAEKQVKNSKRTWCFSVEHAQIIVPWFLKDSVNKLKG